LEKKFLSSSKNSSYQSQRKENPPRGRSPILKTYNQEEGKTTPQKGKRRPQFYMNPLIHKGKKKGKEVLDHVLSSREEERAPSSRATRVKAEYVWFFPDESRGKSPYSQERKRVKPTKPVVGEAPEPKEKKGGKNHVSAKEKRNPPPSLKGEFLSKPS